MPREVKIYNSKVIAFFNLFISILFYIPSIFVLIDAKYVLGVSLFLIGSFAIYGFLQMLFDRRPQIIINAEGITTIKAGFQKWQDIRNETIISNRLRTPSYYLEYQYPGSKERVSLSGSAIDHDEVRKALVEFRGMATK